MYRTRQNILPTLKALASPLIEFSFPFSLENKVILVFTIQKVHKRNNLNSNRDRNLPVPFREPDSQWVSVSSSRCSTWQQTFSFTVPKEL